jgi:hypothetical protein
VCAGLIATREISKVRTRSALSIQCVLIILLVEFKSQLILSQWEPRSRPPVMFVMLQWSSSRFSWQPCDPTSCKMDRMLIKLYWSVKCKTSCWFSPCGSSGTRVTLYIGRTPVYKIICGWWCTALNPNDAILMVTLHWIFSIGGVSRSHWFGS